MKVGFIGLGKMGANMVERLLKGGHEVVGFDLNERAIDDAVKKGAIGATSREDMIQKLPEPKVIWLMVPSGSPVDENIAEVVEHFAEGDIIIDGGNSNWRNTQRRAETLKSKGIHFIDCGTSGGVWGLEEGFCLMYGGDEAACAYVEPIFRTLGAGA